MRSPLTIIVPAKHETQTIIATLNTLSQNVKTPHRVLVVNISDKNDKTANLVTSYIKTHKHVTILNKIHTHGTFGMAIKEGFDSVKNGVVVLFMGDACDRAADIDRMYTHIEDGWDMVAASRYMVGGKKIGGPPIQSLFSWIVCITLKALTGIPTWDVSNAFKMYKRELLDTVIIHQSSGVEASMFIALQVYFQGAKIKEIPTVWRGRTAGKSKFRFFERLPRYIRIYVWATHQTIRRIIDRKESFM